MLCKTVGVWMQRPRCLLSKSQSLRPTRSLMLANCSVWLSVFSTLRTDVHCQSCCVPVSSLLHIVRSMFTMWQLYAWATWPLSAEKGWSLNLHLMWFLTACYGLMCLLVTPPASAHWNESHFVIRASIIRAYKPAKCWVVWERREKKTGCKLIVTLDRRTKKMWDKCMH